MHSNTYIVPENVGCASLWIHGPGPTFLDCHIVFNFVELFNLYFLCNTCADKGDKECDEPAMAEEDPSEVRRSSAASFADNHSFQPSVPHGFPVYTPDFAQEPLSSSDASSLKFSEQLTEESPQPHPPVGSGPVEEGEQPTEETPQPHPPVGSGPVEEGEQLTEETPQPQPPVGSGPVEEGEQLTEETPQPQPPVGSGPVEEGEQLTEETPQLNKAVEERGPQGGIWRGSEHGTHNTASICEHSGVVVLSRYTLHVWSTEWYTWKDPVGFFMQQCDIGSMHSNT